jgi:hypothetical protein
VPGSRGATFMPGEALIDYYEALIERMPKTGLAAARAVGLLSRIVSLVEAVRRAISTAGCIAERSRGCKPLRGKPCVTGCASIVTAPDAVWKYKSNPFTARLTDSALILATEELEMTIDRGSALIKLPSVEGKKEFKIDLTNVDGIMSEYYTIMYTLKRLEEPLRKALENLSRCSREKQLAC